MKVLLIISISLYTALGTFPPDPLSDEYVDWINRHQTTWKATKNYNKAALYNFVNNWKGVLTQPEPTVRKIHEIPDDVVIPPSFDAREQWPECESIGKVVDQGSCGSCYVVAPVTAMTDRICIHSGRKKKPTVSAMNALACSVYGSGCYGGQPYQTWDWWATDGIVTGGWYNDLTHGCQSYGYSPCDHPGNSSNALNPPCNPTTTNPTCLEVCDEGTNLIYENEKTYGEPSYYTGYEVENIQYEIMTNGPVTATIIQYVDFFFYTEGVYQMTPNTTDNGSHAIKIIGWGEENDVPYWLVVNSFNEDWGDKGFIKMLRGEDHCRIETYIVAGLPKLE